MNVFIVDDDKHILSILCKILQKDHNVVSASSFKEAETALNDYFPIVAILDLNLGDGNGLDLLPKLPSEAVIIIISATKNPEKTVEPVLKGREYYVLKKPFKITDVKDIIKRASIHHAIQQLQKIKIETKVMKSFEKQMRELQSKGG